MHNCGYRRKRLFNLRKSRIVSLPPSDEGGVTLVRDGGRDGRIDECLGKFRQSELSQSAPFERFNASAF